jgi:hypothetical protein
MRGVWAQLAAFSVAVAPTYGQPCEAEWTGAFAFGRPDDAVRTMSLLDTGAGPALYIGGFFEHVGGGDAGGIVKWDGDRWDAMAGGVDGFVYAISVFDDGTGPAIYAGGFFNSAGGVPARNFARWDGSAWHAVEGAEKISIVRAMAVYDSGDGPELVVATDASPYIRRWNGNQWRTLEAGVDGPVRALAVFDAGDEPLLVAGGSFTRSGQMVVNHIAGWNGNAWRTLGAGTNEDVRGLYAADLGDGPRLYAGGDFTSAGDVSVSFVASWDSVAWSPLGSGMWAEDLNATNVNAFMLFDDGSGPAIYAGGDFDQAGGEDCNNIARWNGQAWSPLEDTLMFDQPNWVGALAAFDSGDGTRLWAGGDFHVQGGSPFLSTWDGTEWSEPPNLGTPAPAEDFAAFDDGSGIGVFVAPGPTTHIARFDGESWDNSIPGTSGPVYTLEVFNDGGGASLYAGGMFGYAGGVKAARIARWDGHDWTPLGPGVSAAVLTMLAFSDGPEGLLYVGGSFLEAGGAPASRIASWDGQNWSPLGSGLDGVPLAMAVFDEGDGPRLFVGGTFKQAGGLATAYIARWDGSGWSAVGSGMNSWVRALQVFDDGSGPALYAAGLFTKAGDTPAAGIARWNGTNWSPVGNGLPMQGWALAVFDAGEGPALYAAWNAGEGESSLAKWDGTQWSAAGSSIPDVYTLASLTDALGAALYLGGGFTAVEGVSSHHIARFGCTIPACGADCDGNASLDLFDFLCFVNQFNDGSPESDCTGEGELDLFDFLCFVNAFNAGCE